MREEIQGYVKLQVELVKASVEKQLDLELKHNKKLFLHGYNEHADENNKKLNKWWSKWAGIKFRQIINAEDFTMEIVGSRFQVTPINKNMADFFNEVNKYFKNKGRYDAYMEPEFVQIYLFGARHWAVETEFKRLIVLKTTLSKLKDEEPIFLGLNELNLFTNKLD